MRGGREEDKRGEVKRYWFFEVKRKKDEGVL